MTNLLKKIISQLPDQPGVYLFYDQAGALIYVGKATSLLHRVRGYFSGQKSPRPIEEMIHEVVKIKHFATASALEAAILEGVYIKKFLPKYNVKWRDDKSWNYLALTRSKFPKLESVREHDLEAYANKYTDFFGPYPGLNTKEAIKILRRLFYVSNCEPDQKRPCFYYQLNQCLGVCAGEISAKDYKQMVIRPLKLFLKGNKKKVKTDLVKAMSLASENEEYEEAARLRNQLSALEKIQDIALLNKSFIVDKEGAVKREKIRIEGYDISNLGVSDKVGSLVVFNESGPIKSQYRKFNIKTVVGQSDVDCLTEVLNRRLTHAEWPLPQVFLVDGGLPQVNRTKLILKSHNIAIPVIGIAKGPDRKKNEFLVADNGGKILGQPAGDWLKLNKIILIRVRDEAHRFAIAFNRQKRRLIV